jgi:CheY-like chemotaxis protein
MRWTAAAALALVLSGILCMPVSGISPAPDYEKILQLRLDYQDGKYSVSAVDVRYGRAPDLNLQNGYLNGVILDADGRQLKSFSFPEPGHAYGDIMVSSGGDDLIGVTRGPAPENLVVTLPYLPDMWRFRLSDSRGGSVLMLADLDPALAAFCTEYPEDPDCLVRATPSQSVLPGPGLYTILAALLMFSVIITAVIAVWTLRRRVKGKGQKKPVVLIVDDDPDIVSLIDIFLKKMGYDTISASSGQECLTLLTKQVPDLILLDVRMEPLDGWQTLEAIRKNSRTKSIPVLMLTGRRLTAALAKQYHICIDDYLTKPFRQNELSTAVSSILMRKQRLNETLVLAKKAGVDKEKFCELARLSRRISASKKIIGILREPDGIPMWADLSNKEDTAVIEQIHVSTTASEKRAEQLKQEINSVFRAKGIPELTW